MLQLIKIVNESQHQMSTHGFFFIYNQWTCYHSLENARLSSQAKKNESNG